MANCVNRPVKINSRIKDCPQSISAGGMEGGGCYINLSFGGEEEDGERRGAKTAELDQNKVFPKALNVQYTVHWSWVSFSACTARWQHNERCLISAFMWHWLSVKTAFSHSG